MRKVWFYLFHLVLGSVICEWPVANEKVNSWYLYWFLSKPTYQKQEDIACFEISRPTSWSCFRSNASIKHYLGYIFLLFVVIFIKFHIFPFKSTKNQLKPYHNRNRVIYSVVWYTTYENALSVLNMRQMVLQVSRYFLKHLCVVNLKKNSLYRSKGIEIYFLFSLVINSRQTALC